MARITTILTSRFLINLQEVKQKLAGSSRSLSVQLEFGHSTSRNSANLFGSFGGEISFDGDNVRDDDAEGTEVETEDVSEAGSGYT